MVSKRQTNSQKIDALSGEVQDLSGEVRDLKVALSGDESLGIKGPFDRIFILFSELPCQNHNERLSVLETAKAVNNGVSKERGRIYGMVKRILLPGAGGAGLLALLEHLTF